LLCVASLFSWLWIRRPRLGTGLIPYHPLRFAVPSPRGFFRVGGSGGRFGGRQAGVEKEMAGNVSDLTSLCFSRSKRGKR